MTVVGRGLMGNLKWKLFDDFVQVDDGYLRLWCRRELLGAINFRAVGLGGFCFARVSDADLYRFLILFRNESTEIN